jgi:class 3 adenylate cyclase/predicted ATPase
VATCPSCSSSVPDGAKFCPSCGSPLVQRGDERRVVTVLFADVVGYTGLSESRDPEGVKYLLDQCFERLAADVTSHGGRLDKIVGDELMAVFGAPVAHEDDPERAVRAALQMQRTLAQHATETGGEIAMRIGVNTGEVVVGNLRAGGDVTALGDVVNIASRLEKSAEPWHVLVGDATYEATREVIDYDPVGELDVRGRGARVRTWRAMEPLGPPGFRPGRMRTPLFGRKAELGMLWHALGTTIEHKRPHLVLLVGDAGMGKTVLVDQVVEMARDEHDALVLQGRCLPYGEANPWWPVAEALRQSCGISPDDAADVAAAKCRERIAAVVGTTDEGAEASRVSDGLLYLMGYEGPLANVEPARARDEAVRSIQVALAANALRQPVVVTLSELHWADAIVLDLIDTMFARLRGVPILLLATARPELEDRWSPRPGRHNMLVVNLDALSASESESLARSLLPTTASPDTVAAVVERSGGNPLFIYELAMLLGETKAGILSGRIDAVELPATLRGLVAARIDALDDAARSALEDAAVVGRTGPVGALHALAETHGANAGGELLASLADRDLLVVSDGEYEFRSDLVRDVAYETLTKAERARRHATVGDWLASSARKTEREEEQLERIAHHYAMAAELVEQLGRVDGVPAEIRTRAIAWLEKAALRAEARETPATSIHLLEHALSLVGEDDGRRRAAFLLRRARGLALQREMERAHADVGAALGLAYTHEDDELRARALTIRGEIEQMEGNLEASAATLEEAVGIWRRLGDRGGEAEALRLWGFTSIHRAQLDDAERAISEALAISRNLGDTRGEAWALQNLAWAAFTRGDNDLAEERLQASADLFKRIGDVGGNGWAVGLLGFVWYFKGRLDEAGEVAEKSIEFTRQSGDRWAYGMMLNLLAGVRLWKGGTKDALDHARQADGIFSEMNDDMGISMSRNILATGLLMTGRRDEALEIAESLRTRSGVMIGLGALLGSAMLHAVAGQTDRALEILAEHAGFEQSPGAAAATPDVDVNLALVRLLHGDVDEAYRRAARAWSSDPDDPGERANIACVLSLAAAAAGRPRDALAAADEALGTGGTYLDRLRAQIGRAYAHAQLGESAAAEDAMASARAIVEETQDDLNRALVGLASAVLHNADETSYEEDLRALGVDSVPWMRAFRCARRG